MHTINTKNILNTVQNKSISRHILPVLTLVRSLIILMFLILWLFDSAGHCYAIYPSLRTYRNNNQSTINQSCLPQRLTTVAVGA